MKLLSLYRGLKKVLRTLAIILAAIIVATILIGIVLGCLGTIIVGVASILAVLLMFAYNLVVPACGGPAITFRISVGLVILTMILIGFLHAVRK